MTTDQIAKNFLIECREDYVGLWSLLWDIKRVYGELSKNEQQTVVQEIIRPLLEKQNIIAGNFSSDPKNLTFYSIQKSPHDIIRDIISEWNKLEKEPSIGDIVWFKAI